MKYYLFTFLLIGLAFHHVAAQVTREQLENVYGMAYDAFLNKNFKAVEENLASYPLSRAREIMESLEQKYPEDFFDDGNMLLSLGGLTFHKIISNEIAANLIYWSKDHYSKKFNGVFVVSFVFEDNRWKFFTLNIKQTDEYAKRINTSDYSFLESAEFQLMKEVPKPIERKPKEEKVIANLNISNAAYLVTVYINGEKFETKGSMDSPLLSSIRKGENEIIIQCKLKPGEKEPDSVSINVYLNNDQSKTVFKWEESDPVSETVKKFVIK